MSILTGRKIRESVNNGLLKIEPFNEARIGPAIYDLCLSYKVPAIPIGENGHCVRKFHQGWLIAQSATPITAVSSGCRNRTSTAFLTKS